MEYTVFTLPVSQRSFRDGHNLDARGCLRHSADDRLYGDAPY